MDLWLKFTNVVNIGNIGTATTLILFGVYGYYKVRRYIAQQQNEFVAYVATLTEAQTARIEKCVHAIPGHPENTDTSPKVPLD